MLGRLPVAGESISTVDSTMTLFFLFKYVEILHEMLIVVTAVGQAGKFQSELHYSFAAHSLFKENETIDAWIILFSL